MNTKNIIKSKSNALFFASLLLFGIKIQAQNKIKDSLKNETNQLQEVVVKSLSEEQIEENKIRNNVMPVTIITSKQFENRASNLNEILARQAGVQIRQSGGLGSDSRISIRGLEGKRVQIYIDSKPLNTPDGSLGINDLPLQIIERIEIYKGAVPASLGGDGLGSAVNVILKHRDVSYIDANASYQSYNTKSVGLIIKKTFDKQGIEIGAGIFNNSSDNNYTMLSPYQPGLKIKRDHDKYNSLLCGAAIRFHKLWFDEIELEGAIVKTDKQIQGIQKNIQEVFSKGDALVGSFSLIKKKFFTDNLAFNYSLALINFNVKFSDTSPFSYQWDGTRTASIYGQGELGVGPNLSTTKQKELRQRLNLNYKVNEFFNVNFNSNFRKGSLDPKDDLGNSFAGKNLFNYPGNLTSVINGLTFESSFFDDKLLFSTAIKQFYNFVDGYNTSVYLNGNPDKISNTTNQTGYNFGGRYNFTKSFLIKASHEKGVRIPVNSEFFGDGILITPAIFLKPEIAYNTNFGLIFDTTFKNDNRLQIESNVFYTQVSDLIQLSGNGLSLGYVNYAKATISGVDVDIKSDITSFLYASFNATYQKIIDSNEFIPGTENVKNPTYKLDIPNVPKLFYNWSLEFHKDNWFLQNSKTRIIYDGSKVNEFNYGFKLSFYDNLKIPAYFSHSFSIEQSFNKGRYVVTAEANNFTNQIIINNFNQPLPGSTFRIKLRYLLLGKIKH